MQNLFHKIIKKLHMLKIDKIEAKINWNENANELLQK